MNSSIFYFIENIKNTKIDYALINVFVEKLITRTKFLFFENENHFEKIFTNLKIKFIVLYFKQRENIII